MPQRRSSSANYYAPQPQQQQLQSAPPAAEDLILEAKRLLDQAKALDLKKRQMAISKLPFANKNYKSKRQGSCDPAP